MSDDDALPDQLLDLLVYAPLGFVLEAKELLPKLAERGRGQVTLTRLAGKVAAQQGRGEVARLVDEVVAAAATILGTDTARDPDQAEAEAEAEAEAGGEVDPELRDPLAAPDPEPLEGYDQLTAAQLIPKLAELDAQTLAAVEAYEQANRQRSTVLNRTAQLLS